MKAVTYQSYGPASVLQLRDVPMPEPTENEIRINVQACEVTKGDCELRSFKFAVQWFAVPLRIALGIRKPRRQILGGYVAGIVDAVGTQVTQFKVGQKVFGSTQLRLGGYGQFVCVPENFSFATMPESVSFAQAAAVLLGGFNAWHFMKLANVKAGQKVLINGAGGSIGVYGLQIAKAFGAHVTVVDAPHKEAMLRNLGADHFINYQTQSFVNNGEHYHVILNMVAQGKFTEFRNALTANGCYLMANPRVSDMLQAFFTNKFSTRRAVFSFAGERKHELEELKTMLDNGDLKAVVDSEMPLAEAVAAHQRVESEQRLGAVVLVHGDYPTNESD